MPKKQDKLEEIDKHIKKIDLVIDDLVAEVYELEQEIKKKREKT